MNGGTSGFANYWRIFGRAIATTIAGLRVTLKYLFSRPITVEYPDVLPEIPDGWRGLHAFESDRCICCRACERICPAQCIVIETEGKGKAATLLRYEIDYGKCVFCNLCAESCPTGCLWMAGEWDLAAYTRESCIVRLEGKDPDEERKKLWPSMKNHPARLKEKAKKGAASGPKRPKPAAGGGESPKEREG